jgi:phosphatidylglycerophosphate synthase
MNSSHNKIDRDTATRMLRKITLKIAELFNSMGISPNAVTLSRFLIFGCGAAFFFFIGGYFYNLLGLVFLFINYLFDLVDGDLARKFNKRTKIGEILDKHLDAVLINLILLAISVNLFSSDSPLRYFTIFALSGQALSVGISKFYEDRFGISCVAKSSLEMEAMLNKNRADFWSNFLLELLSPGHVSSSFFSTIRYYLIIGVLFGILPIMIAIYAIAINLRWIVLLIVLVRYYSLDSKDKKNIFKTFEIVENNKKLF